MHYIDALKVFAGLFSIVNPFGIIPVFLSLTVEDDPGSRRHIARITALSTTIVLWISTFLGDPILSFFGISIASFRVGGGILILLMAISMMHARLSRVKHSPEEAEEAVQKESIAVVPLAIPFLAGPGAISSVILYSHQAEGIEQKLLLCLIISLIGLSVWVALRLSEPISQRLGATGINIIIRLMGLILASIAVEFMARGLIGLFPGLAGGT